MTQEIHFSVFQGFMREMISLSWGTRMEHAASATQQSCCGQSCKKGGIIATTSLNLFKSSACFENWRERHTDSGNGRGLALFLLYHYTLGVLERTKPIGQGGNVATVSPVTPIIQSVELVGPNPDLLSFFNPNGIEIASHVGNLVTLLARAMALPEQQIVEAIITLGVQFVGQRFEICPYTATRGNPAPTGKILFFVPFPPGPANRQRLAREILANLNYYLRFIPRWDPPFKRMSNKATALRSAKLIA